VNSKAAAGDASSLFKDFDRISSMFKSSNAGDLRSIVVSMT
jgi:hypothetical protein